MKPSTVHRARLLKRIALAAAVCAAAAPSALGVPPGGPSSSASGGAAGPHVQTAVPPGWSMGVNEYLARLDAYETWVQGDAFATGPALDAKQLARHFADEQEYLARLHAYETWERTNGASPTNPVTVDRSPTARDSVAKPSDGLPLTDSGLDWGNAGVGIAIGLGAASLLGAALLHGRRRRGTLAGA